MDFQKNRKLIIGLSITSGILITLSCFGIYCYSKAGDFIQKFEEDFKKVIEEQKCKNIITNIKESDVCYIQRDGDKCGYTILNKSSATEYVKVLGDSDKDKLKPVFSNNSLLSLETTNFDEKKLTSVVGDVGFIVRVGLLFKGKQLFKVVNQLSHFIHDSVKNKPGDKHVLQCFIHFPSVTEAKVYGYDFDISKTEVKVMGDKKEIKYEGNEKSKGETQQMMAFILIKVMETASKKEGNKSGAAAVQGVAPTGEQPVAPQGQPEAVPVPAAAPEAQQAAAAQQGEVPAQQPVAVPAPPPVAPQQEQVPPVA